MNSAFGVQIYERQNGQFDQAQEYLGRNVGTRPSQIKGTVSIERENKICTVVLLKHLQQTNHLVALNLATLLDNLPG